MKQMAKPFKKTGYQTYLWDYPSRKRTIEEHAQILAQRLQQVATQNRGESIHFVTHSLGGVILRAALSHPDCPLEAKTGKVIMLSPPNQGSCFARSLGQYKCIRKVFQSKAGKQLLTCENFDYLGSFPKSVKVLVISGTLGWNPYISEPNDGKVGVSEACLESSHKHVTLRCGHCWMMYSRKVIDLAFRFVMELAPS